MNPKIPTGWRRYLWPLLSRKVQTAVVAAVLAYLASVGIEVDETRITTIAAILSGSVAIIFGIAIEDNGAKRS